MAPELSIVTRCYNSGRFLRETIASGVAAAEGVDFEWVFVDDRSTDDTVSIIESFGHPAFRLVRHEQNQGPHATMMTGMLAARGRYVVLLDHDDLVPPQAMQARLQAMRGGATAVFGAIEYVDGEGRPYKTTAFGQAPRTLSGIPGLMAMFRRPTWPLKQGGLMFRRDRWTPEQGFDIPFLLDMVRSGGVEFVPAKVLGYRTYRGQISGRRSGRLRNFFRFFWARQAFRVLPPYLAIPVAMYKTAVEVAKVAWVQVSDRK